MSFIPTCAPFFQGFVQLFATIMRYQAFRFVIGVWDNFVAQALRFSLQETNEDIALCVALFTMRVQYLIL